MKYLSESDMNSLLEKMSPDDIKVIGEDNFKKKFEIANKLSLLDINVALKRSKKDSDQLTELLAMLELQKTFNDRALRQPLDEIDVMLPNIYQNEINVDPEALIQNTKIKAGKEDAVKALVIQRCWEVILEYMRDNKYGGNEMTEIEKIIDKLEVDKETIVNGESNIKDTSIKSIEDTIERLNNLNAEFLIGSIPADARLVASAKKCLRDNSLIDKIFGPEMNERFCQIFGAFICTALPNVSVHIAKNLAALLIWSIAKKADSNIKSRDYKSLIFRAYIIKLMIDIEPGSKESVLYMNYALFPLILEFVKNESIMKLVSNSDTILYNSAKVKNEK